MWLFKMWVVPNKGQIKVFAEHWSRFKVVFSSMHEPHGMHMHETGKEACVCTSVQKLEWVSHHKSELFIASHDKIRCLGCWGCCQSLGNSSYLSEMAWHLAMHTHWRILLFSWKIVPEMLCWYRTLWSCLDWSKLFSTFVTARSWSFMQDLADTHHCMIPFKVAACFLCWHCRVISLAAEIIE